MNYTEKYNDVTKMPSEYVIAHCISCDCAMGAGVVIPIMNKHPFLKRYCIEYVRKQNKEFNLPSLGTAYRYQDQNGTVYNMFTKRFVGYKAGVGISYEYYLKTLEKCLIDVKKQMLTNNETFIAMPKIGCGLDKCKWEDVSKLIKSVFENTDINIVICVFK